MSYIISNMIFSMIARSPRAPDFRFVASRAIARNASSVNFRCTDSISNSFEYCLVKAFLGSFRIRTRADSSSSSSVAITGRRPMNSGIKPNFSKSSVCTSCNRSVGRRPSLSSKWPPKPMRFRPVRLRIMSSKPTKAPPQMKRILVVSTCRNSCWGCFLPPFGGTLAIVPSMIFSNACCTPSPDTSRVIDGLSDLRDILSISSI